MSDSDQAEPQYDAPPLGAYPVEEHLKAQQEQIHPTLDTPFHEAAEPVTEESAPVSEENQEQQHSE